MKPMLKPTPMEALERLIMSGLIEQRPSRKKPGAILENISEEYRKAISELRSDDIKTVRI
jgi:hypothetical protein